MRERGLDRIPSVLALAFVALLVTPLVTLAASGLPATITMTPTSAGPGSEIEVTGLDFPAGQAIDLRLTTTAGAVPVGTAQTGEAGFFRQAVTLPADAPAGFWELRATAPDGSVAVVLFESGAAFAAAAAASSATGAASGNSPTDIVVMLVVAVLIAAVGSGAAYVYYQAKLGGAQPGMSDGADPFWSGAASETDPALSATDEPSWIATSSSADEATWTTATSKS